MFTEVESTSELVFDFIREAGWLSQVDLKWRPPS